MNDDQMHQRLGEFADRWTAEFTEPPVPKPVARPTSRRAWVGPTALASLAAAAVVGVLVATNIGDHRANPAVSPPSTGSATPVESADTLSDDGGEGAADDLPETIEIDGTVYRLGAAVPWYEAITDGESIAVSTGPEVRGACDTSFYRLQMTDTAGELTLTAFTYTADPEVDLGCDAIGLPPAVATIALPSQPVTNLVDGVSGRSHPLRPLLFPTDLPDGAERDRSYSTDWPQLTDPGRPAPYWTTLTWKHDSRTLSLRQYNDWPGPASARGDEIAVRGGTGWILNDDPEPGSRCLDWNDDTIGQTLLCSLGGDGTPALGPEDLMQIADSLAPPAASGLPIGSETTLETPATTPGPTAAEVPLEGTTWYLIGRINNALEIREPVDLDRWIRFADGMLTLNGYVDHVGNSDIPVCPTVAVPATVTNGVVIFGEGALSTDEARAACDGSILESEPGSVGVTLFGRELRVNSVRGMNRTELIYRADPPAEPTVPDSVELGFLPPLSSDTARERLTNPLQSKKFEATGITGRDIVDPGITMEFAVDEVSLYAGCNNGGAGYSIRDATINFSVGGWTAAGCLGPEGEQEQWLQAFADGAVAYELTDDTLKLTANDQTMTLRQTGTVEPPDLPTPTTGEAAPFTLSATIDEIVIDDGAHPLPDLEPGQFWDTAPRVWIGAAVAFDVGCGQLWSSNTGTTDAPIAGAYDGQWLVDCPMNRNALAHALRYILSGEMHIERDGAFVTITGRDGLVITGHIP